MTIKLELTPEQADLVVKTLRYAANAASVAFAEAPIHGDINRVRYVATYIEHRRLDVFGHPRYADPCLCHTCTVARTGGPL